MKAVMEIAPLFTHKTVEILSSLDTIILQVIFIQLKTTCKNNN